MAAQPEKLIDNGEATALWGVLRHPLSDGSLVTSATAASLHSCVKHENLYDRGRAGVAGTGLSLAHFVTQIRKPDAMVGFRAILFFTVGEPGSGRQQ